jgi:hypothetical protein
VQPHIISELQSVPHTKLLNRLHFQVLMPSINQAWLCLAEHRRRLVVGSAYAAAVGAGGQRWRTQRPGAHHRGAAQKSGEHPFSDVGAVRRLEGGLDQEGAHPTSRESCSRNDRPPASNSSRELQVTFHTWSVMPDQAF